MKSEKPIRVIKRSERSTTEASASERTINGKGAVRVVRSWVQELRQKKFEELTQGIEHLFSEPVLDHTPKA